jgi:hypothetical protein
LGHLGSSRQPERRPCRSCSAFALRTSSDRAQRLAIASGSANNIEGMADLSVTLSDPPTRAQVQEMLTKLNQLIDALQH